MSDLALPPPPAPRKEALALSLNRLRQVLAGDVSGHEREWTATVGEALTSVEAALRQHRASAKATDDGPLAEVDETRPTLAKQANELRSDHDDFLTQIVALREEMRRAVQALQPATNPTATTHVPDFGAIREKSEQLLSGLQENNEAETKLVLDSVNTDIGVGD